MDELPDELLLQILHYATPHDLKKFSKMNARFARLVSEKRLWTWIDARGDESSDPEIDYFNEKVHEGTRAYMIRAAKKSDISASITPEIIQSWGNFKNLTVLVLEDLYFDCKKVVLCHFPSCLEELSLNRSNFKNYLKFFHFASKVLKKLRVITLEHCLTLGDSIVMPLANFEKLEIVSLYGCMSVKDSLVPLTMSTKHGFPCLKVLDVRCTGLGNDLLRLATELEHLGELYFHCYFDYMEEYVRDEGKPRVELEKLLQCHNLDLSTNAGLLEACDRPVIEHYKAQFSDEGLRSYRRAAFRPSGYVPPKSLLYARPYGKCTCEKDETTEPQPSTSASSSGRAQGAKRRRPSDASEEPQAKKPCVTTTFQPCFPLPDGNVHVAPPPSPSVASCTSCTLPKRIVIEVKLLGRPREAGDALNPVVVLRRPINPDEFGRERQVALNSLSLRGSKRVTDHGLESLRQLDLELIDVTGTGVTAAGIAAFEARMPRCRVVHETRCACRPR